MNASQPFYHPTAEQSQSLDGYHCWLPCFFKYAAREAARSFAPACFDVLPGVLLPSGRSTILGKKPAAVPSSCTAGWLGCAWFGGQMQAPDTKLCFPCTSCSEQRGTAAAAEHLAVLLMATTTANRCATRGTMRPLADLFITATSHPTQNTVERAFQCRQSEGLCCDRDARQEHSGTVPVQRCSGANRQQCRP